ncbi:MAG: sulfurtransferase TusA family protein [bacterium]
MSERIDARGLSCPQPIVLTRNRMKEKGQGIFEVIVDTASSRDNIARLADNEGWNISEKIMGDEFYLTLIRD